MSGPFTEDPQGLIPAQAWLDRYEETTTRLMREHEERIRNPRPPTEGPEAWAHVEALVDLVHLERVARIVERKRREQDDTGD